MYLLSRAVTDEVENSRKGLFRVHRKASGNEVRPLIRSFHKPAPGWSRSFHSTSSEGMKIRDPPVVHPVPARAAALIEFNFGDPFDVLDIQQRARRKSPPDVVVGPQTFAV